MDARLSIILLIILPLFCHAQRISKIDSLTKILGSDNLTIEEQWQLHLDLSHYQTNVVTSISHAEQALHLSIKQEDLIKTARSFEEIAEVQRRIGNLAEANEASLSALRIYEKEERQLKQSIIFAQLGSHAVISKDYEEARLYLKTSLDIYKTHSPKQNNISLMELNLGEVFRLSGIYDSALFWSQSSLSHAATAAEPQQDVIISYAKGNLGMIYNAMDSLPKAREYLAEGIKLTKQLDDPYATSTYLADLGLLEQKEENIRRAEKYLLQGYEMALKAELKEQIRDISKLLVAHYQQQRAFEEAFSYQQVFQQYQDSLVNRENVRKVEQAKANYEIDKRETEISFLSQINEQKSTLATGLGTGLAILLVLLSIIFITNRRLKHSNQVITDQKDQLQQLNYTKNYLFSVVSHDLKSPINLLERQQQRAVDFLNAQQVEQARDTTLTVLQTTKSMSHLLTNVLHWAMEQNNQLLFSPGYHPIAILVAATLADYEALIADKGITLSTQLKEGNHEVYLDKELFKIAFRNLIDNAIKYTPEHGQITVSAEKDAEKIHLTVEDSGPGIPPLILEEVNAYEQLTVEKVKNSQGSGLGLLLSKTLILKNYGTILFENLKEQGVSISIQLPTQAPI